MRVARKITNGKVDVNGGRDNAMAPFGGYIAVRVVFSFGGVRELGSRIGRSLPDQVDSLARAPRHNRSHLGQVTGTLKRTGGGFFFATFAVRKNYSLNACAVILTVGASEEL